MTARICPEPGCPELDCTTHNRDTRRPHSTQRGYDRHWARIRASYLRRHPQCERDGCDQAATDVHHIDGRGPNGSNADTNLQALCHPHHSQVTASTQQGPR